MATCFELTMIEVAEYRTSHFTTFGSTRRGTSNGRATSTSSSCSSWKSTPRRIPGGEADIERIAQMAQEGCLVGNALDVPVRVDLAIHDAAVVEATP